MKIGYFAVFLFLLVFCFGPRETLASGYETREGKVFFDEALLDFVDQATFEELQDNFSKDKNFCLYKNEKLASCRVKDFEVLGGGYAKDDYYVFFEDQRIEGAEAKTFISLEGDGYARDRLRVYYNGVESTGIKSDTFILLGSGYAKDSSGVYFENELLGGVDPETVEVIDESYVKDKSKVFFNGQIILDADPETFQVMTEGYASDKSYYFHNGNAVAKLTNPVYKRYRKNNLRDVCYSENVSPEETETKKELENGFSSDDLCVYFNDELIDLSQAKSFEVLSENLAKDSNFVYYIKEGELKKIPFAEPSSFKDLGSNYYKDAFAVYYGDNFKMINGADASTFKVVCTLDTCNYQAEDAKRFYADGIEVGVDEKTKQMIGEARMVFTSSSDLNPLLSYNSVKRNLAGEIEVSNKFLHDLSLGVYGLEETDKQAILNFIMYGTQTTRNLGAGERAGVVNSYKTAFGKLPSSDQEWTDVIKIANGRWPTQRNEVAEERAERRFRYIYHRTPLSIDQFDNAAITIMAYGLRTAKRNTENEKAAILTFRKMFLEYPQSSSDWDMVRAIAYSGASR